jgi:broad specificity phosphatase PhoE
MSRVYLIRHGQAGLRQNYDTLSDLGRMQAVALGAWFAREGITLDRVVAGSLERQRETARIAAASDPLIDPRFAEFDLDQVYRSLAPRLCERDAQFREEYLAMQRAIGAADAPVHRQWNRCDVTVFQTWQAGAAVDGESWEEFKTRATSTMDLIRGVASGEQVAIFTSATPIGLLLASLLGSGDEQAMRMAGACYNSSVTTLRVRGGDVSLMGFNSVAHLDDASMRTFR